MNKIFLSEKHQDKKSLLESLPVQYVSTPSKADVCVGEFSECKGTKGIIVEMGDSLEGEVSKNLFSLERDDDKGLLDLVSFFFDSAKDRFVEDTLQFEQRIIKGANQYLAQGDLSEDFLKNYFDLIVISNNTSKFLTLDDLLEVLQEKLVTTGIIDSISKISNPGQCEGLIALHNNDYLKIELDESNKKSLFFAALVIDLASSYYQREIALRDEVSLWEDVFNLVSPPAVILSPVGEMILHNPHFIRLQLLPTKCLDYSDGERLEFDSDVYRIIRADFEIDGQKRIFLMFVKELESASTQNISTQELGIISSSVAHELKNPLAGIIAAVSVIQLEEGFDDETIQSLEEMKSGAERCKELVEIFLGFSKKELVSKGSIDFFDGLQQALGLLRFRMVEKNIRLDIVRDPRSDRFSREINMSVVAMIFYLLLSEVVTEYSHYNLVVQEGRSDKNLNACFIQREDYIRLEFEFPEGFELNLARTKLVDHLLRLDNLELSVKAGAIEIGGNDA